MGQKHPGTAGIVGIVIQTEPEMTRGFVVVPGIAVEPTTGETHLRHHISPNGFYRGRQVLKNKSEA